MVAHLLILSSCELGECGQFSLCRALPTNGGDRDRGILEGLLVGTHEVYYCAGFARFGAKHF